MNTITAANVGSAVRWLATVALTHFAGASWTAGADGQAIIAGAAAAAMLAWSFWANKKKVG